MAKTTKKTKKKARLDASQNALRIVEQAIGGRDWFGHRLGDGLAGWARLTGLSFQPE